MSLRLRRRFGFAGGALTAYEDERVGVSGETRTVRRIQRSVTSDLLISEIERPEIRPMRDIVATIQPEQDDIVRADAARPSACRARPAPGRPRWACTGSRTCCTRTRSR